MASQQNVGSMAFILGVLIAVVAGIIAVALSGVPGIEYVPLILVLLGLVVGFLNIKDKQIDSFLIAAIALTLLASVGGYLNTLDAVTIALGTYLVTILGYIGVFVAPAALVVALKSIYRLARSPQV